MKSEAMRGFYTAEKQLFVYHKFFHIQGAWLIHWFGFKPYALKALSLIYIIASLPLLTVIYKKGSESKKYVLLLFALFLSFFHTMNLGFVFRPETHLVFWGLLSYLLLDTYFESQKKWLLAASAFVSGIGIATHLNGVVFTGAAVLLLWINRKWWAGFFYGVIATWGLLFFFTYDVRSFDDLHQLYLQLTNWRDVATGKYGWESLLRVFSETSRYFHSPPEMIYSLMLLLLLIPARKYLIQSHKRVLYYTGLLSLCVAQVTHGNNTNYLMYALPFLLLLAVWSFEKLLTEKRSTLAWTAVAIFLVGSWGYDTSKFWGKDIEIAHADFAELENVAQLLPANSNVLSPHDLIFPGVEKFRIQSFINYRDNVEKQLLPQTAEALFAEAQKFDIEYVVVNESNKEFFNIIEKNYGPYKLLPEPSLKKHWIYKRMQPQQTKN
ncbi:hypothetical protein [Bdellovibrio sp. HCB-162]|uniref:hypothetical protein n=1 Tax=Bdellovibrio sp. HCB-162 TaxID=3394234 RepID=UPI0039BC8192